MSKLQGKAAIVTGATSGMGRATALLFAREGASVVASGRDLERGGASSTRSAPAGAGRVRGRRREPARDERAPGGRVPARVRRGRHGRVLRGMLGPRLGDRRSRRDVEADARREPRRRLLPAALSPPGAAGARRGIDRGRRVDRGLQGVPEPRGLLRLARERSSLSSGRSRSTRAEGPHQPALPRAGRHAAHLGVRGRIPGPVEEPSPTSAERRSSSAWANRRTWPEPRCSSPRATRAG